MISYTCPSLAALILLSIPLYGATSEPDQTYVYKRTAIIIRQGNIHEQFGVDAIVNAANSSLIGYAGIAKNIQDAAGPKEFIDFIATFYNNGTATGTSKITPAFKLNRNIDPKKRIKWIINAIAPDCRDQAQAARAGTLLTNAYTSCLDYALPKKATELKTMLLDARGTRFKDFTKGYSDDDYTIRSIALPMLGVGIFQCDYDLSINALVEAVRTWIDAHPKSTLTTVIFLHWTDRTSIQKIRPKLIAAVRKKLGTLPPTSTGLE